MEAHTWRENTPDGKMLYKACHHGKKWVLSRSPKVGRSEEEIWEEIPFTREDWVKLRDLLWRKYQRKRGAWRIIEDIDKLLEDEFPEDDGETTPDADESYEDWEDVGK